MLLVCVKLSSKHVLGIELDDVVGREAVDAGEEAGDLAAGAHRRDRARLRQFADDEIAGLDLVDAPFRDRGLREIRAAHEAGLWIVGAEERRARHRDVDGDHLGLGVVHLLHDCRAEIGVGLEFDHGVDVALKEALGVGERGRAVEAVVDDLQIDAGGLGVGDEALFDLGAEGDVTLKIGEADHELLAVARRRRRDSILHHRR